MQKSAPNFKAAFILLPFDIAPPNASGPSYHSLISCINAKGDWNPACPPAPVAIAIKPSAPFSIAFFAKLFVVTS